MKRNNGLAGLWNRLQALWRSRETHAGYWKWIASYAKPFIPRILLLMTMNLAVSLLNVGMALISKNIIDRATNSSGSIYSFVGLYFLFTVISLGINAAGSVLSVVTGERFSFGIRMQIYEKIIHSHWMDTQRYHTGDLMTRLTSDAGNIADGIIGVIPDIIKLLVELVVVFFTLFYFSPLLAVFALALSPLAALISLVLGRALKRLQVKVQESEANYRSFLQESLANLLIVKAFSNEDYAADRLTELRNERFYWVFKKSRLSIATTGSMSFTFQLGYIIAFAYGAIQVSQKIITYGTMSVFITLVSRIQAPIYMLAQNLPKLVSVIASAGRVIELQDIPLEKRGEKAIAHGPVGVRMEDVTFGYVDQTVLEHASFEIRPGQFAAIIGESGIGKTSLVRLIVSFIEDYKGRVLFFDEAGNAEPAGADTRRFLAYVPQGNTLFSGTIRENIRMGRLDATEEEIFDALRMSAGYEFVMELPEGLDTRVGERGYGLSEGQAQRISIARALLRNAPVLILDEATSALDENTELQVLEGIQRLEPKPTCLLITHRKSVLAYCDRSIRIENKRIVEEPCLK